MIDTLPELNEKLINCVLNHIEANRKGYQQNTWLDLRGSEETEWCGTKACFAGWTVLLSTPMEEWYRWRDAFYKHNHVDDEARVRLGLTQGEADYLFRAASGSSLVNTWVIKNRLDIIKMRRLIRRPL